MFISCGVWNRTSEVMFMRHDGMPILAAVKQQSTDFHKHSTAKEMFNQ